MTTHPLSSPIYDTIGQRYAHHRRPDPNIAARILAAIGDARSVLNVGAGAGSYEPVDRPVAAVEPSPVMIAQRPAQAAPALQARAEALPFADRSFDAVTAFLTLHHWTDRARGLAECRRVARRRVILLTWDPEADAFWLTRDYLPHVTEIDRRQFPPMDAYAQLFGPGARVEVAGLPVPRDCIDGFLGAYWARPEAYLDPQVRSGISSFAHPGAEAGLARLREDLATGAWQARYRQLLGEDALDLGYRLVVASLD